MFGGRFVSPSDFNCQLCALSFPTAQICGFMIGQKRSTDIFWHVSVPKEILLLHTQKAHKYYLSKHSCHSPRLLRKATKNNFKITCFKNNQPIHHSSLWHGAHSEKKPDIAIGSRGSSLKRVSGITQLGKLIPHKIPGRDYGFSYTLWRNKPLI